jgi:hypothetical protein
LAHGLVGEPVPTSPQHAPAIDINSDVATFTALHGTLLTLRRSVVELTFGNVNSSSVMPQAVRSHFARNSFLLRA